jgi:hypothetical protein
VRRDRPGVLGRCERVGASTMAWARGEVPMQRFARRSIAGGQFPRGGIFDITDRRVGIGPGADLWSRRRRAVRTPGSCPRGNLGWIHAARVEEMQRCLFENDHPPQLAGRDDLPVSETLDRPALNDRDERPARRTPPGPDRGIRRSEPHCTRRPSRLWNSLARDLSL